jgi:transglutaminase-like putative cysteine protease
MIDIQPIFRWKYGRFPALALFVFATGTALADVLTLQGGEEKAADQFRYEQGVFTAPAAESVPRNAVRDWWLAAEPEAAPAEGDQQQNMSPRLDTDAVQALQAYAETGRQMAAQYPGVKGVHVLDDGVYRLTHDKRRVYRYHFAGLILNEEMLDWANLSLGFTEGRSRSRILLGRCLTADGRLLELDPATATVSVPSRGSVYFDPNARVLNATIPGAEVGAVIEFIYEMEVYAPEDWRLFFPSFFFQSDIPVWHSVFTVEVPKDIPLYSWVENWDLPSRRLPLWKRVMRGLLPNRRKPWRKSKIRDEDGHILAAYTWQKNSVPPLQEEPQMPPWYEVVPAVHATTMKSWDHLNQLTGGMQLERIQTTPEITRLATELTAEAQTSDQRIAALYHWVQKNIRYISVKSSLSSGWAGHPATETLRQGYGDCTDKSVLFASLLRSIGIEAEPIVLRTNDEGLFIPRYPVLACNHCITLVHTGDGRPLYLDTTSQDYRFPAFRGDDHGVLGLNFIAGRHGIIPVPPPMLADGKESNDVIVVQPNGDIIVETRSRYSGMYEANLRGGWKRVPENARPQMMQQFLNSIAPGAALQDFDMGDPQDLDRQFFLTYTYRLPDYLADGGPYRIMEIPDRQMSFAEVSLSERRYPLVYTTAKALHRQQKIILPPGLEIAETPKDLRLTGKHIRYSETFRQDGNVLYVDTLFERYDQRIPVEDYADYRELLLTIQEHTQKPLYLRQGNDP